MQEKPDAAGDRLRDQQQRTTPRTRGRPLPTGQQEEARRKPAPLEDPYMESSEEESSEDDEEKRRVLQEAEDMQDYNGKDEEDEPARPEKKKGTAVRHYITVSAMRKLVGGIPSRRMCMQAMP